MTREEARRKYWRVYKADNIFQHRLVQAYGKKRAGDMRYYPKKQTAEVRRAGKVHEKLSGEMVKLALIAFKR